MWSLLHYAGARLFVWPLLSPSLFVFNFFYFLHVTFCSSDSKIQPCISLLHIFNNVALGFFSVHRGVVMRLFINWSWWIGSWYLTMFVSSLENVLSLVTPQNPAFIPQNVLKAVKKITCHKKPSKCWELNLRVPLWPNGFEPQIALWSTWSRGVKFLLFGY